VARVVEKGSVLDGKSVGGGPSDMSAASAGRAPRPAPYDLALMRLAEERIAFARLIRQELGVRAGEVRA